MTPAHMVARFRVGRPKWVGVVLLLLAGAVQAIPAVPECMQLAASRPQTGGVELRIQWAEHTAVSTYFLYYKGELRVVAILDEHGTERCMPPAEWNVRRPR